MSTVTAFSADLLRIDAPAVASELQDFLRDTVFYQLRRKGLVVGLSGGIDSSVVGALAARALGPERIVGLMMGVWLLSNAFGNKLAGWAAGFFSTMPLQQLFFDVTAVLFVTAAIMFALVKPIRRLMGGVH